jgi:hypothetical protein
MNRLPVVLALWLLPALAAAQVSEACIVELNRFDEAMEASHARLRLAVPGLPPERCSAVSAHIDAMVKGRDLYLRCLPASRDRDESVTQLNVSIADFRRIHANMMCEGVLIPTSLSAAQ